jgi:hypothetical protein
LQSLSTLAIHIHACPRDPKQFANSSAVSDRAKSRADTPVRADVLSFVSFLTFFVNACVSCCFLTTISSNCAFVWIVFVPYSHITHSWFSYVCAKELRESAILQNLKIQRQTTETMRNIKKVGKKWAEMRRQLWTELSDKAHLMRVLEFTTSILQRAMDALEPELIYMSAPRSGQDETVPGTPVTHHSDEVVGNDGSKRPPTPDADWRCKECTGCANLIGRIAENHQLLNGVQVWADDMNRDITRAAGQLFRETFVSYEGPITEISDPTTPASALLSPTTPFTPTTPGISDEMLLLSVVGDSDDTNPELWAPFVGEEKMNPMWMMDGIEVDMSLAEWSEHLTAEYSAQYTEGWEEWSILNPLFELVNQLQGLQNSEPASFWACRGDRYDAAVVFKPKKHRNKVDWKLAAAAEADKLEKEDKMEDQFRLRRQEQAAAMKKKRQGKVRAIKPKSASLVPESESEDENDGKEEGQFMSNMFRNSVAENEEFDRTRTEWNARNQTPPNGMVRGARKAFGSQKKNMHSGRLDDRYEVFAQKESGAARRKAHSLHKNINNVAGLPQLKRELVNDFDFDPDDAAPLVAGMATAFNKHGDGSALDYIAQFCLLDDYKLRLFKIVFDKTAENGVMTAEQLEKGLLRVHHNGITKSQIGVATILLDFVEAGVIDPLHKTGDLTEDVTVNFKIFCVLAAISEQLVSMHPSLAKFMVGEEPQKLRKNLTKAKDWFMTMFMDNDYQAAGAISLDDFELEMRAGRADPFVITTVVDTLRLQGLDELSFLDYLSYLPMFANLHEQVMVNPLRFSMDTDWSSKKLPTHSTPSIRTIPRSMSSRQMDDYTYLEGDDVSVGGGVEPIQEQDGDEDEGVDEDDDEEEVEEEKVKMEGAMVVLVRGGEELLADN